MTLPAPTLDALHAATLALAKVIEEARTAALFVVGQLLTGEQVKSLPVGAMFKDKDGDEFRVTAPGEFEWAYSNSESGLDPVEFEPHTISYLPVVPAEPEDKPEPESDDRFKIGEKVRIVEGFYMGRSSGVVGRVGTLQKIRPNWDGTGRTCYKVNGDLGGVIESAEPAKPTGEIPLTLLALHNDREVTITRAGPDLHFQIRETRSGERTLAYLDRNHARTIAASLLTFADEDS